MKTIKELKEKAKSLGINKAIYESKGFITAVALLADISDQEIIAIATNSAEKEKKLIERERRVFEKECESKIEHINILELNIKKQKEDTNSAIDILSDTAKKYQNLTNVLRGEVEEMPPFETAEYRDKYRFSILEQSKQCITRIDSNVDCAHCIFRKIHWEINENEEKGE